MDEKKGLIFGIHPFGNAGMADGSAVGKPDDFDKVGARIMELKGEAPVFMVRAYAHFTGNNEQDILGQIGLLLQIPVDWDMVLCFRSPSSDVSSWLDLIRTIISRHGAQLNTLQITNEANLVNVPGAGDGYFAAASEALVKGVIAARQAIDKTVHVTEIGFSAVPALHSSADFWKDLKRFGGEKFCHALDYVGIDLYPDVFGGPIAIENIPTVVRQTLK
ncbi:MAG TPA: hypothetical protein VHQ01_12245, partial [Pyrinomonadaceae bacterium]|nr:hypothetical protein [Pyrinomonadaceae bacterium]